MRICPNCGTEITSLIRMNRVAKEYQFSIDKTTPPVFKHDPNDPDDTENIEDKPIQLKGKRKPVKKAYINDKYDNAECFMCQKCREVIFTDEKSAFDALRENYIEMKMGVCPKCGAEIDFLKNSITMLENYRYTMDNEGKLQYDYEKGMYDQKETFDCPVCGEHLFTNEENALKFLKNAKKQD